MPVPDDAAIEHSRQLVSAIIERIEQRGGVIGFDEYMEMALYEPGLGYYSASLPKFGAEGDFVTAPEISSFHVTLSKIKNSFFLSIKKE